MRNYLIIGASSGIGEALFHVLKSEGHHVFGTSRSKDGFIHFSAGDSFDTSSLPDHLDGIVYCPGTINLKPFNRISAADFTQELNTNVLGAVEVLQKVFPKLTKSPNPSVVLFSTVAVQTGMAFHASIAAAKGAIEGLTRSLAAEWAPRNIRVNAIAPSLTDTPLAAALLSTPEKKEASAKRHPLGKVGNPTELAELAAFLLSEKAGFITGQIIHADGGMGNLK